MSPQITPATRIIKIKKIRLNPSILGTNKKGVIL